MDQKCLYIALAETSMARVVSSSYILVRLLLYAEDQNIFWREILNARLTTQKCAQKPIETWCTSTHMLRTPKYAHSIHGA